MFMRMIKTKEVRKYCITFLAVLVLCLCVAETKAAAQSFTARTGNQATFETLAEAHAAAPQVISGYEGNQGRTFGSHPALDAYLQQPCYVYRSADMFGGRAAARMNTNVIVFTDQSFASREDAYAYLKELGVLDIVDAVTGSVILVSPQGESFGARDAAFYYALQTAMLSQKDYVITEKGNLYYADAEYYGGYGYLYMIGIDGGATFFNNYIAVNFDFVSRVAGALLFGGEMDEVRSIADFVPVYLAGASQSVISRYCAENATDAVFKEHDKTTWYCQAQPLKRVTSVAEGERAALVQDAFETMLLKTMRVPVGCEGIYSSGTPYCGYNFDEAPYSLSRRSLVTDGKTSGGIVVTAHQNDATFQYLEDEYGPYVDTWYEYVPEKVLSGVALDNTVPLVLCLEGMGDDPRLFVEETGLLTLAEDNAIALVAPDIQNMDQSTETLTALVRWMLERYPALDERRVYAFGYSTGGYLADCLGSCYPEMFAAVAPFAPTNYRFPDNEGVKMDKYDVPVIFCTSSYDERRLIGKCGHINEAFSNRIAMWASYNGAAKVAFDFQKYPLSGFAGDSMTMEKLNFEYDSLTWYLNNEEGVPVVALDYIKGIKHALYPEYADIAWNFMSHYSREPDTGAICFSINGK